MLKLIWDDGTPACLPKWAKEELVSRRLGEMELRRRNADLLMQLKRAQGTPYMDAMFESMNELRPDK